MNRNLGFFTNGYNYLIQTHPDTDRGAAVHSREGGIRGHHAIGDGLRQLLGAFSLIVNQFQSISSFAAVIARLSAMVGAVEKGPPSARTAVAVVEDDGRLAYEGLTLFSPEGGREVLKNLTVFIPRGTSVLVVGPNEAARTALFRATAGIWPAGVGTLVRPPLDAIFFLPQRPYLPPGTLRELLLRTGQEQVITDDQITTALRDGAWTPFRRGLVAWTQSTIGRPSFR